MARGSDDLWRRQGRQRSEVQRSFYCPSPWAHVTAIACGLHYKMRALAFIAAGLGLAAHHAWCTHASILLILACQVPLVRPACQDLCAFLFAPTFRWLSDICPVCKPELHQAHQMYDHSFPCESRQHDLGPVTPSDAWLSTYFGPFPQHWHMTCSQSECWDGVLPKNRWGLQSSLVGADALVVQPYLLANWRV